MYLSAIRWGGGGGGGEGGGEGHTTTPKFPPLHSRVSVSVTLSARSNIFWLTAHVGGE